MVPGLCRVVQGRALIYTVVPVDALWMLGITDQFQPFVGFIDCSFIQLFHNLAGDQALVRSWVLSKRE